MKFRQVFHAYRKSLNDKNKFVSDDGITIFRAPSVKGVLTLSIFSSFFLYIHHHILFFRTFMTTLRNLIFIVSCKRCWISIHLLTHLVFQACAFHPLPCSHSKMVALAAAGVLKNEPSTDKPIQRFYPIGTPGKPWTEVEDNEWKSQTKCQRSYKEEVLDKLKDFENHSFLKVEQYGALSHDTSRYPLMAVLSKEWKQDRPCVLITGGVHGYETSGVQGAIQFLKHGKYLDQINVLVAPCISPWAYEHIQRWQAELKDPNRSFVDETNDSGQGSTEESQALMNYLTNLNAKWSCHVDLHETTDTDATEFMPAKHAKAGSPYHGEEIPDGFYLVGDDQNPQLDFQTSVIESVKKVTHIAPPDKNGEIIEVPIAKEGIILVPVKQLGLCCSMTGGTYVTTTEVYPDSPMVTDDICNQAQVAAIEGAIEYVLKH